MGISAVLLAYQEAENLNVLLPQIRQQLTATGEPFEIIVVDAPQALDPTPAICQQHGARYTNQRYPQFGGAFRTGIEAARYDKFLIMDSDGSHRTEYITPIYQRFLQGADLVIGSRYVQGGATYDAASSVLMSRLLNSIFRKVIGIKARDISTDFRMYDTAQLKKVQLTCSNYDILQEVLMKLKLNNPKLRIEEVPICFDKRMYGKSKRNLLVFMCSYIRTMFRLLRMRLQAAHHSR